jgi:hypothetical protein
MQAEQEKFKQQGRELEEERDQKIKGFRNTNSDLQAECTRLEQELREKRDQVKELEAARKRLPGGEEDSEWREKEAELRREGQRRNRELQEQLLLATKHGRKLDEQIRLLAAQAQQLQQQGYVAYNQTTTAGLDFDNPTVSQLKRRSRNSNSLSSITISSPLPAYSQIDPAIIAPLGFASARSANAPPGFAPGPFMDLSTDMHMRHDEASARGASAPLSPSATALLPSCSPVTCIFKPVDEHSQQPAWL